MPDIKILIFVGIILFQLIRFLTKNSASKNAPTHTPSSTTLEEMLEQMNQPSPPKTSQQQFPKKPAPIIANEVNYEKPIKSKKKNKNAKAFEESQTNVVNYEQTQPTYTERDKKRFEEFEPEVQRNNYLEKIKNPQNFKDAFIISEILNRKYI